MEVSWKELVIRTAIVLVLASCITAGILLYLKHRKDTAPVNDPSRTDAVLPPAHDGVFVSDFGTMTFNGDGRSVVIDAGEYFSVITGIPCGTSEGSYRFLSAADSSGERVPVLYDRAEEFEITIGSESYVLRTGIAVNNGNAVRNESGTIREDMIPFVFLDDHKFFDIRFEKQ